MPSASLIHNPHSGRHLDGGDPLAEAVAALESAGVEVEAMGGGLGEQIAASRRTRSDLIVVSGGDGTIRAVIEAHRGGGRPIGILPGGTMNLLATDLDVPEDIAGAAAVIAAGHRRAVDFAVVDGHVFVHSLFTGLPVRIGRHREARRGRMTPMDRVGLLAHALTTLPRDPKLWLKAQTGDGTRSVVSQSFAICVGTISTQLLPRPHRLDIANGVMTVFALQPDSGADVAKMLFHGAIGQLAEDSSVELLVATSAKIAGSRRRIHAMLDGEALLIRSPCTVEIRSGEIEVFAPKEAL